MFEKAYWISMMQKKPVSDAKHQKKKKPPNQTQRVYAHRLRTLSLLTFWRQIHEETIRKPINQLYHCPETLKKLLPAFYRPVLARFIPAVLKGDMLGLMLGLILGLSSLSVPLSMASSLSCCFLYWSKDSSWKPEKQRDY